MNEEHYEGSKEKIYSVNGRGDTFESILARRLQRRSLLAGAAAAVGGIVVNNAFASRTGCVSGRVARASPVASPVGVADSLRFAAIEASDGPDLVVADGYTAVPFLAWGEPLFPDAPAFDPSAQTAAAQAATGRLQPRLRRASFHCRSARTPRITGCWSSTTSTPIRS